jgi:hypothetical protein
MTVIVLLGCARHDAPPAAASTQTAAVQQVAAPAEPNSSAPRPSPVVSAEPADDPEPVARVEETGNPAIVIPAGTRVRVRLGQTLDTKYTRPGEVFGATLDAPLVVAGRVVVPKGTPFTGVIVASKNSGRFRGRARLEVRLRSFRMNGATYPVATAASTRVSGSHKKRNLAFMGGGPAAAAGTTTAFVTGKKRVRLPVETPLVFSLRSNVAVRRG